MFYLHQVTLSDSCHQIFKMIELLSIPLKKPSEIDITKPLQNALNSVYSTISQKDFTEAISEFNKLRKNALWRAFEKCDSSLEMMYRYYDQICVLETKIPPGEIQLPFKWKDAFDRTIFGGKLSLTISSLAYEKVCVLFNIAALQSVIASSQSLDNDESLKLAAKLFQQSAGILSYLKSNVMSIVQQELTPDMSPETLEALSSLMLAQAQEIFTYKAIHDDMKDSIIAKLAAQTEDLYAETFKLFQKEIFRAFWDKEWVPLISGKLFGYHGLSEYFQSKVCKSNKCIGEEIARLKLSVEMFENALSKSSKLSFHQDYCNKASGRLAEVTKDNDFIYHERIPDAKSLTAISRAAVAKVLPITDKFSSDFKDLFHDLLPLNLYHAVTTFESQKCDLVNSEVAKLRNSKQILNGTLASLNLPAAIEDISGTEIPSSLKEKAALLRDAGGIEDLEKKMNELPELLQRNDEILKEAENLLNDEQATDNHLRSQFKERWTRLPSEKLTHQLRLNAGKYRELINNAVRADKIIKEKYEMHRNSLRILSMPPDALTSYIPAGTAIHESRTVRDLRDLMEKVETLKAEQDVIESELQSTKVDPQAAFSDTLLKDGVINENNLVKETLNKYYGHLKQQVADSIKTQESLISSIQLKHTEFAKEHVSIGSAREQMMCKLAAAYNAFSELKNNLQEGIKFYNDLTQLLIIFQSKVSDYCFARKTEKEELLKDLTSSLSNLSFDNTSRPPISEPSMSRQQDNVPTLPYPIVDPRMMPFPQYGNAPMAPSYDGKTPLPGVFNPYMGRPGNF